MQDRFRKPAAMARLLWFVVALWTSLTAAAVASATTGCSIVVPSVMDCLGFVSDGSTDPEPTKQCCVGIRGVIKNAPECICEAVKVPPAMGNLNMTRIIGLPDACSLKTPDLDCIKNAMPPPSPAPAPAMSSPTPAPAPSPSPITPPLAPSPSPTTTPATPTAPPTAPPTQSPPHSVPIPPPVSAPPAPSPLPSVAAPPPASSSPSPPSPAPETPVIPLAVDDAPAPAPNRASKSSDATKLATFMALAGSIVFVLSGLMS